MCLVEASLQIRLFIQAFFFLTDKLVFIVLMGVYGEPLYRIARHTI